MPNYPDIIGQGRDLFAELKSTASDFYNKPLQSIGSLVDSLAPNPRAASKQMAQGAQDLYKGNYLSGIENGLGGAMQLEAGGPQLGMIAYHGSPNIFEKFDINTHGGSTTGLADAGHGVNLSSSKDAADVYRQLSAKNVYTVGGEIFNESNPIHRASSILYNQRHSGIRDSAIKELENDIYSDQGQKIKEIAPDVHARDMETLSVLKNKNIDIPEKARQIGGALYEVRVPDEIKNRLVDISSPVGSIINKFPKAAGVSEKDTFIDAYDKLAYHLGGHDKASKYLEKRGIPGTVSISIEPGHDAESYVIFNDTIPKITKINGRDLFSGEK